MRWRIPFEPLPLHARFSLSREDCESTVGKETGFIKPSFFCLWALIAIALGTHPFTACSQDALTSPLTNPPPSQTSPDNPKAQQPRIPFSKLQQTFDSTILPLLQSHCNECHNATDFAGDLDLARFHSLTSVRQDPAPWLEVVIQVESGEMPPASAPPLSDDQRKAFLDWINQYLRTEAYASIGDPGTTTLRRLSNAETNYSIRDLTGIPSLNPTAEFPPDGAAGEGFTNASAALVMSPALFAKYLEAGKKIAEHLVLVPDGIEFSASTTARDWSEEKMSAIRELYSKYSSAGSAIPLNLQGVQFASNDAGVIPLEQYIRALVEHRDQLRSTPSSIDNIASERKLSPKYLKLLHAELTKASPSLLIEPLQKEWNTASVEDVPKLVAMITSWQERLWKFSPVGHIGKRDGPRAWQESLSPLTTSQSIELAFEPPANGHLQGESEFFLAVSVPNASSSRIQDSTASEEDTVEGTWNDARLVLRNGLAISLADSPAIANATSHLIEQELPQTQKYLMALAEAHRTKTPLEKILEAQNEQRELQPAVLLHWANAIQLNPSGPVIPTGHYNDRLTNIGGYDAIRGWGSHQTPSIIVNQAENEIQFSTLRVPGRSVAVHPSPTQESVVQWQAPMSVVQATLRGLVADDDANCGNGVDWRVEHQSSQGVRVLASGSIDNGGRSTWEVTTPFDIRKEDLIRLVISPKNGDHSCDTTQIEFQIVASSRETPNAPLTWDMTTELVDRILEANPLPDLAGRPNVWHYGSQGETPVVPTLLVPDSSIAKFRDAVVNDAPQETISALAFAFSKTLQSTEPTPPSPADQNVRNQVLDWFGPLEWLQSAIRSTMQQSSSRTIPFKGREVLSWRLPKAMLAGGKLLATATLAPMVGPEISERDVSVGQAMATHAKPSMEELITLRPALLLVAGPSTDQHPLVADIQLFQDLFPAALCYVKIVPIDEVVTLQLLHREDDHYKRLMLSDNESMRLDRLWDQLRFISQEPLKLVDAYEQLWQYATQDADPSAFEPLRQPIQERAERFREQLLDAEKPQLDAILQFASRAWRRPLSADERAQLTSTYRLLREDSLTHGESIRLTFASILASAKFLYKFEKQTVGTQATQLDDHELATRLSYFLWSSTPDDRLRELADEGKLTDRAVQQEEVNRMLRDPKVRRLAIEFGCQWLGVRDFDQLDEKSESHFPEFADLRDDMYEETVLFFTDFFQNDRSALTLLDADHTFANQTLADFYSLPMVPDDRGWHRVEGMQAHGRGGILGLATTLAKYSGASRTSAILRGNWVYESLLGMHLPKPPSGVPPLPETLPEGLSERELIELHSTAPDCAHCHAKIDPYGFALESFDAIGRYRKNADTATELTDGTKIEGLSGLREFLSVTQRDRFVRQFCRKLLGYALGRSVQLSDEPVLDSMVAELAQNDYRFSAAVTAIISSPQFHSIRGKDAGQNLQTSSAASENTQ